MNMPSEDDRLESMKILLVGHDPMFRDVLGDSLRDQGAMVIAVGSAEEALRALGDDSFEGIISDYELAGMDGLSFLQQAQATQPRAAQILVTAYGDIDSVSELFRQGIDAVLVKPFPYQDFVEILYESISRKKAGRPPESRRPPGKR